MPMDSSCKNILCPSSEQHWESPQTEWGRLLIGIQPEKWFWNAKAYASAFFVQVGCFSYLLECVSSVTSQKWIWLFINLMQYFTYFKNRSRWRKDVVYCVLLSSSSSKSHGWYFLSLVFIVGINVWDGDSAAWLFSSYKLHRSHDSISAKFTCIHIGGRKGFNFTNWVKLIFPHKSCTLYCLRYFRYMK